MAKFPKHKIVFIFITKLNGNSDDVCMYICSGCTYMIYIYIYVNINIYLYVYWNRPCHHKYTGASTVNCTRLSADTVLITKWDMFPTKVPWPSMNLYDLFRPGDTIHVHPECLYFNFSRNIYVVFSWNKQIVSLDHPEWINRFICHVSENNTHWSRNNQT